LVKTSFALFVAFCFATVTVKIASAQDYPKYGKAPERTIAAEPSENHPKKGVDETDREFMKNAAIDNEAEISWANSRRGKHRTPRSRVLASG
jgi:hypothetical protein